MVEINDIVDQQSLEVWLKGQPQEVPVWIAHRSAMRLLPFWWNYLLTDMNLAASNSAVLDTLRCNLISGVGMVRTTPEIMSAAEAAASSSASVGASGASQSAARVVEYGSSSRGAIGNAGWAASIAVTYVADQWTIIFEECELIEQGADLSGLPLWRELSNPFEGKWGAVKKQLIATMRSHGDETESDSIAVDWSFWIKWYDDALEGNPPNWDMLERIALIEPEEWDKGAARVNNEILPEILKDYPDVSKHFVGNRFVTTKSIETIRKSIERNRAVVPAQTQGLMAIITAEMERLRSINVMDDIEAKARDRQLSIFQNLAEGIEALEEAMPLGRPPTTEDAEKIDGLLTVYANEFRKWPRENAVDMVDSTVRVALVGMTAGLAVTFGAPILAGVAVGGIAFGGKKMAGAAKSLKDSVSGGS